MAPSKQSPTTPNFELLPGDILLAHQKGFQVFADSIEWFVNGDVSHAFIYLGGGKVLDISWAQGVHIGGLHPYFKKRFVITVRRVPGFTLEEIPRLRQIAYEMAGMEYDVQAIVGLAVRFLIQKLNLRQWLPMWGWLQNPQALTCSEGTSTVMRRLGHLLTNKPDAGVTPHDILISKKATTVGKISGPELKLMVKQGKV